MSWHRAGDLAAEAVLAASLVILGVAIVTHAPWLAIIAAAIAFALYLAGLVLLATRGPE